MNHETIFFLRLFILTGLVLWLERGIERRTKRLEHQRLPAKWQRSLDRTFGVRRG